jgi:hypothetical protein
MPLDEVAGDGKAQVGYLAAAVGSFAKSNDACVTSQLVERRERTHDLIWQPRRTPAKPGGRGVALARPGGEKSGRRPRVA